MSFLGVGLNFKSGSGYWLLASGHWSLVTGFQQAARSRKPATIKLLALPGSPERRQVVILNHLTNQLFNELTEYNLTPETNLLKLIC